MMHTLQHRLTIVGALLALAATAGVGAQQLVRVGGAVIDSEQLAYPILEVSGERLYGISDQGLSIFSLDRPGDPEWLGSFVFPVPPESRDVDGPARAAVRHDVVFVGFGTRMLAIDCRNPSRPVLRGEWTIIGDRIVGLAADGFLHVGSQLWAEDAYALTTFDIANPWRPIRVARQVFDEDLRGLSSLDGVLVADHGGSFSTFDLRSADVPSPAGPFVYDQVAVDIGGASARRNLLVHHRSRTERWVIDLTDPATPFVAGVLSAPELDYEEREDWLIDDGLYLESGFFYVTAWDIRQLSSPELLGAVRHENCDQSGLARAGDFLYVGGGHSLEAWRIREPTHPRIVAELNLPEGEIIRMVVDDHTAYLAADRAGLVTVDLTDPTQPSLLGRLRLQGAARGADIAEGVAAVALGTGAYGLDGGAVAVIEVTDPTHPVELATLEIPNTCSVEDVGIVSELALVTGWPAILTAVDISDPHQPEVVYQFLYENGGDRGLERDDLGLYTWFFGDLAINHDRLVVSQGDGWMPPKRTKILTFDISDPANPTLLSSESTIRIARSLTLHGDKLYWGDMIYLPEFPPSWVWTRRGFWGLKLSNPDSHNQLGATPTWGSGCVGCYSMIVSGYQYAVISIALDGPRAYLGHQDGMLAAVDISDPAKPRCLALTALPGTPAGLEMVDGYLVAGLWKEGLAVLDVGDGPTWERLSTRPAGSFAHEIIVRDQVAYLANEWAGLTTVDVSQPDVPHVLARVPLTYDVERIALDGTDVLVDWGSSTRIGLVDVSNPGDPGPPGEIVLEHIHGYRRSLQSEDGAVLLHSFGQLQQLTGAGSGGYVSTWNLFSSSRWSFLDVATEGGGARLFLVKVDWNKDQDEFQLDVLDAKTGFLFGSAALPPDFECVAAGESVFSVGREDPVLQMYTVPPDHVPRPAGRVVLPESAEMLVAAGDVLYAVGWTTLTAVDVADPARPRVLDTVTHGLSAVDAWHNDTTHTVWLTDGVQLAAFELQYTRPEGAKDRDLSGVDLISPR